MSSGPAVLAAAATPAGSGLRKLGGEIATWELGPPAHAGTSGRDRAGRREPLHLWTFPGLHPRPPHPSPRQHPSSAALTPAAPPRGRLALGVLSCSLKITSLQSLPEIQPPALSPEPQCPAAWWHHTQTSMQLVMSSAETNCEDRPPRGGEELQMGCVLGRPGTALASALQAPQLR